jgi:glycosyltransferase involved in cell wall biosynthesis
LWPALEMRNRVVTAHRLPKIIRFENEEVARLRCQLGTVPAAKIACIIPTYKRPKGLAAAIHSILAQTRQDFVVIIVDDGGGLPDIPADPRLFAVSLSRNCGIAGLVRNVGIRLSDSEFVAFLDDDNVWLPRHLATAVDALDQGADLIYTALRRRNPDGTELDVLSVPFDRRRLSDGPSFMDTNAIVLRRSVNPLFSRIPRTRTMFPREDWEFVWRISAHARVRHVPVATVDYLVNPDSYFTSWSDAKPGQSAATD